MFFIPGNNLDGAHLHAFWIFALSAGVSGKIQIAIQTTTRTDAVIAVIKVAVNFDTGKVRSHTAVVKAGAGGFTAVASGTACAVGDQHALGSGGQPDNPAIDLLLTASQ